MDNTFIGTAAWSIPRTATALFPAAPSQLERYAGRLQAVEINSSFYRDHEDATYEKWARMTPDPFRFAVKLSRRFTHESDWTASELQKTLHGIMHLDSKLRVLLVQLAPRHRFEEAREERLAASIRTIYDGCIMIEPRHSSWTSEAAHQLMARWQIGKVEADPERCEDLHPPHENGLSYRRLHGSPVIYESDYGYPTLQHLAERIRDDISDGRECWCIFDNTKFGRATHNALELTTLLHELPTHAGNSQHFDSVVFP